jgi:(S)-sulfolactate dehydrogenase
MADVVITEFMDGAAIDTLRRDFDVLYDAELVDRPDELAAAVAEARGLIVRNRTRVDAAVLDAAPSLRVVGRLGVGLDNIDLNACRGRCVEVCPATGANAVAVAEYVISAAMVLVRGVFGATASVIAGEWPRQAFVGGEVAGRRLGLVGLGLIARHVASSAGALGMQVAGYDPFVSEDHPAWETVDRAGDLDELISRSDILSLHVPLTDETRGLLGASRLASMPAGAVLINTARGGIVDEDAVAAALRSGHLGGAALDVFADEPVDAGSGARFAGIPNLILTPHVAGITAESNVRVSQVTADNVLRVLQGE